MDPILVDGEEVTCQVEWLSADPGELYLGNAPDVTERVECRNPATHKLFGTRSGQHFYSCDAHYRFLQREVEKR